jgi:hypothetical protein
MRQACDAGRGLAIKFGGATSNIKSAYPPASSRLFTPKRSWIGHSFREKCNAPLRYYWTVPTTEYARVLQPLRIIV